ncbi:retrovirus-related pol polyprotein from transposon TNT 1-94 [Tanacetum coccineum]|uniref:Retrovirus-related pol polyprotein from transposon TNT 1-94 n=1 Tax=Tanacetum coccineum TaxID=301880 RepID=A0ABQ5F7M5_9ASTR
MRMKNARKENEKLLKESNDVQESLLNRIKILENDFQRYQAQSIAFELKLQHKKEKDVFVTSWISKVKKLDDENVYLQFQVDSLIKENENVKLEYQKLFDSIKKIRTQHQKEIHELVENVNQKTNAYGDFDNSSVLGKLICVTPLNKLAQKPRFVSKNIKKKEVSKPVTSQTSPNKKNIISSNTKVIAPGMYKISTKDKIDKCAHSNVNVFTYTRVKDVISVRRPNSRSSSLMSSVLPTTNSRCTSKTSKKVESHVRNNNKSHVTSNVNENVLDATHIAAKSKFVEATPLKANSKGKCKRTIHKSKPVTSTDARLQLLHIDLCGPMRVESINGKRYILVIVDDYSRYTWVYFLRSTDEDPEIIKKFITRIQNETLKSFYEKLGITHQKSVARTPEQNGVVERSNRTLVVVARTMLIFSNSPNFLWAEAVATTCITQNCSLIHTYYNETSYEFTRERKPNVQFFHVFGILRFKGFRIYNRRTRKIMKTINVKFDELTAVAFERNCLEPDSNRIKFQDPSAESSPTPTKEDLDNLFGLMYDEYFEKRTPIVSTDSAAPDTIHNNDTPSSTTIIVSTTTDQTPLQ